MLFRTLANRVSSRLLVTLAPKTKDRIRAMTADRVAAAGSPLLAVLSANDQSGGVGTSCLGVEVAIRKCNLT